MASKKMPGKKPMMDDKEMPHKGQGKKPMPGKGKNMPSKKGCK